MLATQLNSYAAENKLVDNTIIRVEKHIVSVVSHEKRVVVILDLTVLHPGEEVGAKIGSPENLPDVRPQDRAPVQTAPPTAPAVSNASAYGYTATSNSRMNDTVQSPRNSSAKHTTCPISNLNPYQNKWVIKARVTSKSAIRTWSNAKGEGKLFSMDLMDESGEIRATAFKEAVDKYYDMIKVDKVYYISKCVLKTAKKQFTTIKNDYEMSFSNDTVVEECHEATDSVPNVSYSLVPLADISKMEPNSIVVVNDAVLKLNVDFELGDVTQQELESFISYGDKSEADTLNALRQVQTLKKFGLINNFVEARELIEAENIFASHQSLQFLKNWCIKLHRQKESKILFNVAKQSVCLQRIDSLESANNFFTKIHSDALWARIFKFVPKIICLSIKRHDKLK